MVSSTRTSSFLLRGAVAEPQVAGLRPVPEAAEVSLNHMMGAVESAVGAGVPPKPHPSRRGPRQHDSG